MNVVLWWEKCMYVVAVGAVVVAVTAAAVIVVVEVAAAAAMAVAVAAIVMVVVVLVLEYRVMCDYSLGRFYNVQDQIVVPEYSLLVLYWLHRNKCFFATFSSEIAWTWRWQCKVLKVCGKNDLLAVCVSHFSLLFPDLVDFDFISPKHWDEVAKWYDVTVTCVILSVFSLNFVCVCCRVWWEDASPGRRIWEGTYRLLWGIQKLWWVWQSTAYNVPEIPCVSKHVSVDVALMWSFVSLFLLF